MDLLHTSVIGLCDAVVLVLPIQVGVVDWFRGGRVIMDIREGMCDRVTDEVEVSHNKRQHEVFLIHIYLVEEQ